MKSYDFRSAIGVDAEGAKGAVRPRREGHLFAPPLPSWHFPSSSRVPIGKQIFIDEKVRETGLSRIRHGRDLRIQSSALPKGKTLFFVLKILLIFFLRTQAVQAHPFVLARKDGKRAQGGAVNSRREGHLIAPPCTSWHFPSSKQRPIGKDILMDERARGKRTALNGARTGFVESYRVRPQKGKHSFSY